ncbi:hypothetical protein CCR75_004228 [Bremia lactucae]|uniref:GINS subunit domain-containing protein n=1 Tax=Bremia lactucae TaxID=4779 RepID=A0A976IGB1_BRELC|nr:hypothetical protein CCR75_004228 [Bremia lactucae]
MTLNANSRELLRELKRSEWLPPYNVIFINAKVIIEIAQEDLVRQVVEEFLLLEKEITRKMTYCVLFCPKNIIKLPIDCFFCIANRTFEDVFPEHTAVQCGLVVNHQCLLRNKRCLIAYIHYRMKKIKALRWEIGTIIPAQLAENLSQNETQFLNKYDQLLTDYMANFELDLSSDLKPPKELYIEVRVLRDCGELMTESGLVNLEVHSQHFLRRVDVEQLIRQGLLEQIKR